MGKKVLITGASSGLGMGMARHFAARGYDLALCARRTEVLDTLAAELKKRHPAINVITASLDVTQTDAVVKTVKDLAKQMGGLDIVIANAGIAGNHKVGTEHLVKDVAIIQTNVIGAMATIDTAIALFKEQGYGQVVGIASVAAFRGLPAMASYSASKAALGVYMDALRAEMAGSKIKVTCLYPGFIDTPINNTLKNRPFVIDVEKGTKVMVDLIERQVSKSTVPVFPWNVIGKLLKIVPNSLLSKT